MSDISRPFIIGILIAGVITYFFPENLSSWTGNHPFLSMLLMLVAGIPMYVCATASTPIAAALILKGINPGAALVFLIVGPATNAATINIVRNLFNTRALVIYLSMISICALIMGFLLDLIYQMSGIHASAVVGQAAEFFPPEVQLAAAAVLAGLILVNAVREYLKKRNRH